MDKPAGKHSTNESEQASACASTPMQSNTRSEGKSRRKKKDREVAKKEHRKNKKMKLNDYKKQTTKSDTTCKVEEAALRVDVESENTPQPVREKQSELEASPCSQESENCETFLERDVRDLERLEREQTATKEGLAKHHTLLLLEVPETGKSEFEQTTDKERLTRKTEVTELDDTANIDQENVGETGSLETTQTTTDKQDTINAKEVDSISRAQATKIIIEETTPPSNKETSTAIGKIPVAANKAPSYSREISVCGAAEVVATFDQTPVSTDLNTAPAHQIHAMSLDVPEPAEETHEPINPLVHTASCTVYNTVGDMNKEVSGTAVEDGKAPTFTGPTRVSVDQIRLSADWKPSCDDESSVPTHKTTANTQSLSIKTSSSGTLSHATEAQSYASEMPRHADKESSTDKTHFPDEERLTRQTPMTEVDNTANLKKRECITEEKRVGNFTSFDEEDVRDTGSLEISETSTTVGGHEKQGTLCREKADQTGSHATKQHSTEKKRLQKQSTGFRDKAINTERAETRDSTAGEQTTGFQKEVKKESDEKLSFLSVETATPTEGSQALTADQATPNKENASADCTTSQPGDENPRSIGGSSSLPSIETSSIVGKTPEPSDVTPAASEDTHLSADDISSAEEKPAPPEMIRASKVATTSDETPFDTTAVPNSNTHISSGGTPSLVGGYVVSTEGIRAHNDVEMSTPLPFVLADSTQQSNVATSAAIGKTRELADKGPSHSEDISVPGTDEMVSTLDQTSVSADQNTVPAYQMHAVSPEVPSHVPSNTLMHTEYNTGGDMNKEVSGTAVEDSNAPTFSPQTPVSVDQIRPSADGKPSCDDESLVSTHKTTADTQSLSVKTPSSGTLLHAKEAQSYTSEMPRHADMVSSTYKTHFPAFETLDRSQSHVCRTPFNSDNTPRSVSKEIESSTFSRDSENQEICEQEDVDEIGIFEREQIATKEGLAKQITLVLREVPETGKSELEQTSFFFKEKLSDKKEEVSSRDKEAIPAGDTLCFENRPLSFIEAMSHDNQIPAAAEGAASAVKKIKIPAEGSMSHDIKNQSAIGEAAPPLDMQASLVDGATQHADTNPPCDSETHIAFETDESSSTVITQPPHEQTPGDCTATVGDLEHTDPSDVRSGFEQCSTVNGDSENVIDIGLRTGLLKECVLTAASERTSALESPGGKTSKRKKKNKQNKQKPQTKTSTDLIDVRTATDAAAATSDGNVDTQRGQKNGKREKQTKAMTDTTTTGRTEHGNCAANVRFPTETETNTSTNSDVSDTGKAAGATAEDLEDTFKSPGGKKHRKREKSKETMTDTTTTDEGEDVNIAANVQFHAETAKTEETESSSTSAHDSTQIQVSSFHTPGKEPVTELITTTNTTSSPTNEDNAEKVVTEEREDLVTQRTVKKNEGEIVDHVDDTSESGNTVETSGLKLFQDNYPEGHVTSRLHSTGPTDYPVRLSEDGNSDRTGESALIKYDSSCEHIDQNGSSTHQFVKGTKKEQHQESWSHSASSDRRNEESVARELNDVNNRPREEFQQSDPGRAENDKDEAAKTRRDETVFTLPHGSHEKHNNENFRGETIRTEHKRNNAPAALPRTMIHDPADTCYPSQSAAHCRSMEVIVVDTPRTPGLAGHDNDVSHVCTETKALQTDVTAQEANSLTPSSESSQNVSCFTSDTGHFANGNFHDQARTHTHQRIGSVERKEEVQTPADPTPNEARRREDGDFHTYRPRLFASGRLEEQFQSFPPEIQDDDVVDSARDAQKKQTFVRKHETDGNVVMAPRKPIVRPPTFTSTSEPNQHAVFSDSGISMPVNESTSPSRGEHVDKFQEQIYKMQQALSDREAQVQTLQQQLSETGDINQLRQRNRELETEVSYQNEKIKDLARDLRKRIDTNKKTTKKLQDVQQEVNRKDDAIREADEESDRLQASLSGEVTSLRQQLEREKQQRAASESGTADLRGKLAELTSDQSRKDGLIFSLAQSMNKETSEKEKAQALHHQQASTIAILTSEKKYAKETLAECRQQLGSFKTQRLVWKFLAIKHGRKIRSMETTIQDLQKDLQSERNLNSSHTITLKDALNKSESTRSLLVAEQKRNQEMRSEAVQHKDTITRLEAEVKKLKDFVHKVTGEKAKLEGERRQLGEIITSLESQAQQSRKEMERAILEKRVVEDENRSLKDQLAALTQQWTMLHTHTTNTQLTQFTAQLRAKEKELADTTAHKDAQINELDARLRQLEEGRRLIDMEAQRLRETQNTASETKILNQQLEKHNAALNDELSTKTTELAALEREQEQLRANLRESVEQIQRYMQECQATGNQLQMIMAENQRLKLQLETRSQRGRR